MVGVDHSAAVARALGLKLRQVRLAQGCTLQEVASEAGISAPYLSRVERGDRKVPARDVLISICLRGLSLTVAQTDQVLLLAELAPLRRPRAERVAAR